MAKDPICGMTVDESLPLRAERDGQTFYFCSEHCREKFVVQQPAKIIALHPVSTRSAVVMRKPNPPAAPVIAVAAQADRNTTNTVTTTEPQR